MDKIDLSLKFSWNRSLKLCNNDISAEFLLSESSSLFVAAITSPPPSPATCCFQIHINKPNTSEQLLKLLRYFSCWNRNNCWTVSACKMRQLLPLSSRGCPRLFFWIIAYFWKRRRRELFDIRGDRGFLRGGCSSSTINRHGSRFTRSVVIRDAFSLRENCFREEIDGGLDFLG